MLNKWFFIKFYFNLLFTSYGGRYKKWIVELIDQYIQHIDQSIKLHELNASCHIGLCIAFCMQSSALQAPLKCF